MTLLGPLAFLSPWLLLGLLVLPILWWLLRAIPPAPVVRAFPGIRLLMGLEDPEKTPDKTPWWLLLLRLLAVAAAILAFARPVLNPEPGATGRGPLLILADGGWASAPDWQARRDWIDGILARTSRDGRPVAFHAIAHGWPADAAISFGDADSARERVAVLDPKPFPPDRAGFAAWLDGQPGLQFDTIWLHDGLAGPGDAALADALTNAGRVTAVTGGHIPLALGGARLEDSMLMVRVLRPGPGALPPALRAVGPDPQGIERILGITEGAFDEGATETEIAMDLPFELRNRISRIELTTARSAGGVLLADDGLRRRKVGLMAGSKDEEGQQLVQPLHYLRKALEPTAELVEAPLEEMLLTAPDMIVMADIGTLAPLDERRLTEWVENGGLLLRFAGPRLAQTSIGQVEGDPLLPVRLRAGGRSIGGSMSWGAPKRLRPFPEESPFFGLDLPRDVDVSTQVMAQPDPDLPNKVMAALEDGTPLVTGKTLGAGRVVLFHVTANAEWSSLPLSGLFVEMLERLALAAGNVAAETDVTREGQWALDRMLDGYGRLTDPPPLAGVEGNELTDGPRSAEAPPGIYVSGERRVAVNLLGAEDNLAPLSLPAGIAAADMAPPADRDLQAPLLALAALLLAVDVLATLFLSGRLRGPAATAALAAATVLGLAAIPVDLARAQTADDGADTAAIYATNNTVLAYVETGNPRLDAVSEAGLRGLTQVLFNRTAIEPADPIAVRLEEDVLAFYPFLYWPVSETQTTPSDEAYAKLNEFLRSGGMILFDTRDAHLGGGGFGTPNGRVLQRLASKLDIPALEPVPGDHVLTRTFYLLQAFPGRWASADVWVEAAPNAVELDGVPFRNLNDGVTPVVIGGNDWAAAWAIDDAGQFMFPVGSGSGGARQREIAYRFGVNLVMHVMTGNYKSDQVHVPALLERLGQ